MFQIPLPGGGTLYAERAEDVYRAMVYHLGGLQCDADRVVAVPCDLETYRAWALQEVERRRSEVIQEHCKPVYALKVEDAQRVLAKQPSTLLAEEAAARGITVTELATQVLQQHEAAQQVLARTEAWAARAKAAIQQAKDVEEIIRILATERWEMVEVGHNDHETQSSLDSCPS